MKVSSVFLPLFVLTLPEVRLATTTCDAGVQFFKMLPLPV